MNATIRLDAPRDRTILWGIILSVAVHGLLLLPGIQGALESLDFEVEKPPPIIIPMEFTLVSPPPDPGRNQEVSRFLSTVSASARDNVQTDDEGDIPHGEGIIPFPDNPAPDPGAEGGGSRELPPMPEETGDLGEVFKKSKIFDEQSPSRKESLPEQTRDFYNTGSARASIGGIQLSTTAWDFAPYLLDLKHRIKQHWIPPVAFTMLGAISGYTWVRFRIYPDGKMEQHVIVEEVGHESLHRSSVNAVKGGAPFRKLPEDFPDPYLEITFGFYYLLPGDEERFFKSRERGPR